MVRFASVPEIPNPDFYSEFPEDFPKLNLKGMVAFTMIDTVAESQRLKPTPGTENATRFHELVHVVQGQILGVDEVVRRYLRQWAAAVLITGVLNWKSRPMIYKQDFK